VRAEAPSLRRNLSSGRSSHREVDGGRTRRTGLVEPSFADSDFILAGLKGLLIEGVLPQLRLEAAGGKSDCFRRRGAVAFGSLQSTRQP
jgi:hypothetical protein